VLELRRAAVAVVACHAVPEVCDEVERAHPGAVRVASDELLVLGPGGSAPHAVRGVALAAGAEGVVLDVSDGWAARTLAGPSAREAFEHLSRLDLPTEGVVLGDVARVPAVVVARPGAVEIVVPAMWEGHLHATVLERCGHLGVREPLR
jgi:sarcosine oxidase gamma subunit